MTGRGIDQILACPGDPRLHERYMDSALGYVRLAERRHGPIARRAGPDYVWGEALAQWRRACPDIRIANLETSITRSDAFLAKGINYRMSPEDADCLTAAGLDCCALANNHVLDFGREGLLETVQTLDRLGIARAGAGRNLAEAAAPAIITTRAGSRVLALACAAPSSGVPWDWAAGPDRPGINLVSLSDADVDRIAADLDRVRRPGDVAVVSVHWGPNWGYGVSEAQRRFAHALIERAGVSVVHGHSSHHPMGIEVHQGRLILYGCGDFINDYEGIGGYESLRPDLALMYFAVVRASDGALAGLDMVPLRVRRFRLERASPDDAAWLAATLERESARFGAHVERTDRGLALRWREA